MGNRLTQFDKLVKILPCPVRISANVANIGCGCFWWGKIGDLIPYGYKNFNPKIDISPHMKSQIQRVSVLLHEIGHAVHYRRHCRCFIDHHNRFLAEYHAERFALRFMLRYKLKGALRFEIKELSNVKTDFYSKLWQNVITRLQSEKIWQKCIEYL